MSEGVTPTRRCRTRPARGGCHCEAWPPSALTLLVIIWLGVMVRWMVLIYGLYAPADGVFAIIAAIKAAVSGRTPLSLNDLLAAAAILLIVFRLWRFEGGVRDGWARHWALGRSQREWRINAAPSALVALTAVVATSALADEDDRGGRPAAPPTKPSWEFKMTAYPTVVRDGENYTSAIAVADHGPLHLEARYNYESIGARSAFVGWTFSGGEVITWELTPMLGGAWGSTRAFVPGLEVSVAWGRLDFYVEAEYVRDSRGLTHSYLYAWSELGFRPVKWLRMGIAGQRTNAYGGDRDIQRGPFAQVTWGPFTIGGYWFNPGSRNQVFVGSIGAAF